MYSIGDISKFFQISVQTLRFYEKEGLFAPAKKNEETGYRYYTEQQLERLRLIVHLRSLGLPLKEIKHQLEVQQADEYLTFLEQYSDLIGKRIESDISLKQQLDQKIRNMRVARTMPQNIVLYMYFEPVKILRHEQFAINSYEHERAIIDMVDKYRIKVGFGRIGQFFNPGHLESPDGELVCAGLFATEEMFAKETLEKHSDSITMIPGGTYAVLYHQKPTEVLRPVIDILLDDIHQRGLIPQGDIYRTLTCDIGRENPEVDGYQAYLRVLVDSHT